LKKCNVVYQPKIKNLSIDCEKLVEGETIKFQVKLYQDKEDPNLKVADFYKKCNNWEELRKCFNEVKNEFESMTKEE